QVRDQGAPDPGRRPGVLPSAESRTAPVPVPRPERSSRHRRTQSRARRSLYGLDDRGDPPPAPPRGASSLARQASFHPSSQCPGTTRLPGAVMTARNTLAMTTEEIADFLTAQRIGVVCGHDRAGALTARRCEVQQLANRLELRLWPQACPFDLSNH